MDRLTGVQRARRLHIEVALEHGEAAAYWSGRGEEHHAEAERQRARLALDAADRLEDDPFAKEAAEASGD